MPDIRQGKEPREIITCRCNGCRGWVPNLYAGASEHTIIEATRHMGSHWFDEATRRFFKSRVLSWFVMHDGDAYAPTGFMVRESKSASWDGGRAYVVTLWCRFGSQVAGWVGMRDGLPVESCEGMQPFTGKSSERAICDPACQDEAIRLLAACTCHGCRVWGHPWLGNGCEACNAVPGESCAPGCLGVVSVCDTACDTCGAWAGVPCGCAP